MLVAALVACSAWLLATGPEAAVRPAAPRRPAMRTAVAVRRTVRPAVRSYGTVEPAAVVELAVESGGRVVEVARELAPGRRVRSGAVLVRLDDARALAERSKARAELARARARARLARAERERLEALAHSGAATASARLRAEVEWETAAAEVAAAEAALREAERAVRDTTVRAPADAVVRSARVGVGSYLRPGLPFAELAVTTRARVRLPVRDADLALLTHGGGELEGRKVRLTARSAGQERRWSARIAAVDAEVDGRDGTVHLRCEVDDPYGSAALEAGAPLGLGTFVTAEIEGEPFDVVVVPRAALRPDNAVWVVRDRHGPVRRQVEVLRVAGEEAWLASGLGEGEVVCVSCAGPPHRAAPVRGRPAESGS